MHDGKWVTPVDPSQYRCSSGYAMRGGVMHWGVDLAAPDGTTIRAPHDGDIANAGPASGFGNWVVEKVGNVNVIAGHMRSDEILVKPGQHVTEGQPIAKVGAAGQATGPHDHFELRVGSVGINAQRLDPNAVMKDNGINLCP
jgi:murein DD-endopeptidase MepM/ murein hydrolase activator NlpD